MFTQRLKRAFFGKRKSGFFHSIFKFNPGTYTHIHIPTVVPGERTLHTYTPPYGPAGSIADDIIRVFSNM